MDRTCACLLTLALAGVGCAGEGADAGFGSPPPAAEQPTGPSGDGDGAERAIAEADIVQLDGDRLYALSEGGTLSVIDVGELGQLLLLGQTELPGVPFEMYLRGDTLLTLVDRAVTAQGSFAYGPQATDPNAGAMVLAVDVSEPERMDLGLPLSIQGAIADSRVVGDVLYLATYEDTACYGCDGEPKTLVTSFDVSDESDIREVDQLSFGSNAPDGYNLPWGSNWTRSIYVNQERLYIGGHAEIEPGQLYDNTSEPEGIIDVIDVTDPTGRMRQGARIEVAGAILSRWQLDERDGILRVVSQRGAGRTGNGIGSPEVATFAVESTDTFEPLGNTSLVLPRQEGLRAVRFDDDRAYAITYNQTDPLFVIDLSEPELPVQRGELHMPGFVFHMEPFGDRVLGIGLDRDDPQGSLNVSLFDVSNPDAPTMIERIGFGPNNLWEDYQILEQVMAEDQDRIQKAFRVLSGGRIVAPFSGLQDGGCGGDGGVQVIHWQEDTLTRGALLSVPGNPRRALELGDELLAVSDSNVRSFSDDGAMTADLVIGACVPRYGTGDGNWPGGGWPEEGGEYHGHDYYRGCRAAGGGANPVALLTLILGLLVVGRRR